MRLVPNSAKDRIVDVIHPSLVPGDRLDIVTAAFSLFALTDAITRDDAQPLALGIVEWQKQFVAAFKVAAGDTTCVFRDSAFADDVAKTNLPAILEQHGLTNVRSL